MVGLLTFRSSIYNLVKEGVGREFRPLSFSAMARPIYYMTAEVIIMQKKRPQTRKVWIVSSHDNPIDIMDKDRKTMFRLEEELFTAKAKDKTIVIDSITSKKQVGTTSTPYESNYLQKPIQEIKK